MIRIFCLFMLAAAPVLAGPVALKDGEMVVLLGDAFFERDGKYGFIETELTTGNQDMNLRFRNLAWSGDTPNAQARSYFGPPAEGQERLKGHLEMIKPNVVFCCYGSAIAAEGAKAIPPFIADYGRLLDLISKASPCRIVLVSPPAAEAKGSVAPLMEVRNRQLAAVTEAVAKLAAERKLDYIDLYTPLKKAIEDHKEMLTNNGLHFTEAGYQQLAPVVASTLVERSVKGSVASPKLRAVVQAKNELFFNRFRPQNEIYLFGSRKHEQGNNGVEIPQFDPLIEAKEKEIAQLRTVKL